MAKVRFKIAMSLTTFTFVTDGIVAQQYLGAGVVDEMEIHLVPTVTHLKLVKR